MRVEMKCNFGIQPTYEKDDVDDDEDDLSKVGSAAARHGHHTPATLSVLDSRVILATGTCRSASTSLRDDTVLCGSSIQYTQRSDNYNFTVRQITQRGR